MAAAPAFQARLLSNSVTLKQEFPGVQWFFKALEPYVHYVPVKKDLSDLLVQIDWLRRNDDTAHKIAQNAFDFALNNLMFEDVYLYFYLVLQQYSALQNLDKKALLSEMAKDSHWVKIQKRKELKKIADKTCSKIFVFPPGEK